MKKILFVLIIFNLVVNAFADYVLLENELNPYAKTNEVVSSFNTLIGNVGIEGGSNITLSTNDNVITISGGFTQVQSDWNEDNESSPAYITNKPTIPTVPTNVSDFNNDAGYITASYHDDDKQNKLPDVTTSDKALVSTGNNTYEWKDITNVAMTALYKHDITFRTELNGGGSAYLSFSFYDDSQELYDTKAKLAAKYKNKDFVATGNIAGTADGGATESMTNLIRFTVGNGGSGDAWTGIDSAHTAWSFWPQEDNGSFTYAIVSRIGAVSVGLPTTGGNMFGNLIMDGHAASGTPDIIFTHYSNGGVLTTNIILGERSLSIGSNAKPIYLDSIAVGNVECGNSYTFTFGQGAKTGGQYAFAFGNAAKAEAINAIALGPYASTADNNAFVWNGTGTYAATNGVGTFNVNPQNGADGFYIGTDSLRSIITNVVNSVLTDVIDNGLTYNGVTYTLTPQQP